MSELQKRLRDAYKSLSLCQGLRVGYGTFSEAADALDAKDAEIARLTMVAAEHSLCGAVAHECRRLCKEIMGGNLAFIDDDFARCLITLRDERDALRAQIGANAGHGQCLPPDKTLLEYIDDLQAEVRAMSLLYQQAATKLADRDDPRNLKGFDQKTGVHILTPLGMEMLDAADATAAKCNELIAECDALRARLADAEQDAERLRRGLKFYAAGDHFQNDGAFETVSGEPPNFWCDQEGSMVEDGTVAKKYLEGWDVDNDDCWIMPGFDAARGEA